MNSQDQRKKDAHQNQQLLERENAFVSHHQVNEAARSLRKLSDAIRNQQEPELFCACNSLKCDGICRELHLNRPRFANPTAKKDSGVKKMWTEKCPEAYEKATNYRT